LSRQPKQPDVESIITSAQRLRDDVRGLKFTLPVTHVYNPLDYAWPGHEAYVRAFAAGPKRVIFFGMNPGPWGMVQTGVPFGEVNAVRDWMKLRALIGKPNPEHPKRPVLGLDCPRCEISGQRLWGLFAKRFGEAPNFFAEHFVVNYCPLAFMEESGLNRTPDKLPKAEVEALFAACDRHLTRVVQVLKPEWVIGVGGFAMKRAEQALGSGGAKIGAVPHPSPANPAANRNWADMATAALRKLGIWK
jgi:single-strand selective monofunctional uracil DNA glycosylase